MFFLMICHHHQDCSDKRDELRPLHRDWVKSGGEGVASVLTGSALVGNDGQSSGNWGVLEAKDEASARAFAEGDPFARNGIVALIELKRLPDGFAAQNISPRLTRQG